MGHLESEEYGFLVLVFMERHMNGLENLCFVCNIPGMLSSSLLSLHSTPVFSLIRRFSYLSTRLDSDLFEV
jgi:hypothetical protein